VFATVMSAVQVSPGSMLETVSVVDAPVPENEHDPTPEGVDVPYPAVLAGVVNAIESVPALAVPFTVIEEVNAA